MLFNSLIFTVFLPIVFFVYWLVPIKFRNYFLLLASWYFYYSYNPWFLLLLLGTSAFDYWCGKKIYRSTENKRFFLFLSIASNIGVLAAFKYAAFFYNQIANIASSVSETPWPLMENIIIPAGLSFYTFQSLSFTIDVYRGKYPPKEKLYEFMLFVSFFPHMVAGPIVRYKDLMPQLTKISYFQKIDWTSFAKLCIWGYFKKMVIADNLSVIVNKVFEHPQNFNGIELICGAFFFVIQVYCDFSGYSDIATGVAKLFNINLSLNWRRPLFSKSLTEFWQRNHISITSWFRDYLYISLGGNRVSYRRWLLNIFLVFVISGFWHGANTTFIVWGAMHGVFYIAEILLRNKYPNLKINGMLGSIYLLSFHTLSLIAFRAADLIKLHCFYSGIFSYSPSYFEFNSFLNSEDKFYFLIISSLILLLFMKEYNEEYAILNRYPRTYSLTKQIVYAGLVILLFILGNFSAQTFIYFQF